LDSQKEKVKNLFIPHPPESGVIAEERIINAIASADSESLDEESDS
jgi:hypothetical protein